MEPATALAAFAPLLVEGGKALIARFLGQTKDAFRPATIEQWERMRASDLTLFQAMQPAQGSPTYQWVEAVVRLQRPLVAGVALLVWAWSHTLGTPSMDVNNFAAVIGFYLFGDRTLFHVREALKR